MFRNAAYLTLAVMSLGSLAGLSGCAGQDQPVVQEIADTELSYRNEPLTVESGAPVVLFTAAEPGDSQVVPRAFENAPPVIPHSVTDFLPITAEENACGECHLAENAADAEAPSVPPSHRYDIRRDRQLDSLSFANYNCTICHAPQADTGALIENTFVPFYRSEEARTRSNLLEILNEGVE